jgi:hypothetical protein
MERSAKEARLSQSATPPVICLFIILTIALSSAHRIYWAYPAAHRQASTYTTHWLINSCFSTLWLGSRPATIWFSRNSIAALLPLDRQH